MPLSHAELQRILHYDPETGIWTRRTGKRAGNRADHSRSTGYRAVCIHSKRFLAHRLAWFYMTGEWPKTIDHKNRSRHDNRWINLRSCTQSQNLGNQKLSARNLTGLKGVERHGRKWRSWIQQH